MAPAQPLRSRPGAAMLFFKIILFFVILALFFAVSWLWHWAWFVRDRDRGSSGAVLGTAAGDGQGPRRSSSLALKAGMVVLETAVLAGLLLCILSMLG
jgi:hypothetical protein